MAPGPILAEPRITTVVLVAGLLVVSISGCLSGATDPSPAPDGGSGTAEPGNETEELRPTILFLHHRGPCSGSPGLQWMDANALEEDDECVPDGDAPQKVPGMEPVAVFTANGTTEARPAGSPINVTMYVWSLGPYGSYTVSVFCGETELWSDLSAFMTSSVYTEPRRAWFNSGGRTTAEVPADCHLRLELTAQGWVNVTRIQYRDEPAQLWIGPRQDWQ